MTSALLGREGPVAGLLPGRFRVKSTVSVNLVWHACGTRRRRRRRLAAERGY